MKWWLSGRKHRQQHSGRHYTLDLTRVVSPRMAFGALDMSEEEFNKKISSKTGSAAK